MSNGVFLIIIVEQPFFRLAWSSKAERRLKGILEKIDGVTAGLDRVIGDEVVGSVKGVDFPQKQDKSGL